MVDLIRKVIFKSIREVGPGLLIILFVEICFFSLMSEYFLSWENFKNILRASTIIGLMALGQTIVMISGGFDLSVGSISAATALSAAWILQEGYGFFYGILIAIKKTFFIFIRSFFKMILFFYLNKKKYSKYQARFSGLLNSYLNNKSWYRPKIKE